MSALGWLLLAAVLLVPAHPWTRAGALLAASTAGLTLPDSDLWLPLNHRSALTHSLLLPALALARPQWRPLAAGLFLGTGFHLAADLFPNGMRGFATVKLPIAGSIGAAASYWWLGLQSVAASGIGAALAVAAFPRRATLALLAAAAAIGLAYLLVTDGGWWALSTYGAGGWAAWRFRRA